MAELFGNKRMKDFYKMFVKIIEEEQDIFGFLYFMHSHMQKVYDSSYLEKKKKMSKYDKQILFQQSLWSPKDLKKATSYFNQLLTDQKLNKDYLLTRIRRDFLKVFIAV